MSGSSVDERGGRAHESASLFSSGGGEMGERIRAFDWSRTPLGAREHWPRSLRTTVGLLLNSRYPMFLWWGPELTNLYNDAYIPILGARHPEALGGSAPRIWSEIWNVVGPQAEAVLRRKEATWNESVLLVMERHGYTEETYFTFSYSPAPDDEGRVAGVFCACNEDTRRVLGERRLETLRRLGERSLDAPTTTEAVFRAAERTLAENPHDLSFALIYLVEGEGERLRLAARVGLDSGSDASPATIVLEDAKEPWGLAETLRSGSVHVVDDLERRFGRLPAGAWSDDRTRRALVQPLPGSQGRNAGVLITGLSPRLAFTAEYRSFLELVAGHLATALAGVHAYEEERARAEALAELDRAKTVFFSNVSHEFRTPLTLMIGPLGDLLEESTELAPQVREQLELAHRNSLRLLKLVNTLLDFSRIEAGRIEAVYEPTDLAAATTELASIFRSAAERAELELVVDCPPVGEPVWVDREMWEKIVLNLISNALKFTFEGRIEVALRRHGERVELTVADTGTGISRDELPHLFERFRRIKGVRARTHEGSGIGLALVRELAALHGAEVTVESELDRGSRFSVSIPLGLDHLPEDRVRGSRTLESTRVHGEAYLEEARRWLPGRSRELGPADDTPASTADRDDVDGSRVLIADDNADMREYLVRLLEPRYEVVAVPDGEAARAAAVDGGFDLVLTDVMMPRLDGFGLLAALRADSRTRSMPIILLSARAGEESRLEGLGAGADDYVPKPFSARELLVRVEAQLQLQRERRRATADLRESEERFRSMADNAPVMVWVTDPEGSCTYLSRSWYEFTGQTREIALGFGWLEAVHPEDREAAEAVFLEANAERRSFRLEYRLRRHDGVYRWAIDSAAPRFDPDGAFRGYIGSVLDITDRREMEEALREADRRKDEFLALLAHELRNPLAPIRNAAQVLKLIGDESPQQRWAREVVERQGQHLTRLVDDLLDVSRITRGKIRLALGEVDLTGVLRSAIEATRPLIDSRRHELEVSLPGEPVLVSGDEVRLTQVVGNLLHNAAKYTDELGHIRLEATTEDGEAVIRVRDDGIGIPKEMLSRVFDLFSQADGSLDRAQGGLGIGLTLVRELVDMHGGRVAVRSEGPGRGSEFEVRLPTLEPDRGGQEAREAAGGERVREGSALRILVVEDNADAAASLELLLELAGHRVEVAPDGAAALAVAHRLAPHVVLCDIGLPGMSGYEVASWWRAQDDLRPATLIALTGYGDDESRARSAEAGFDHHFVKPVDPEALAALLDALREEVGATAAPRATTGADAEPDG